MTTFFSKPMDFSEKKDVIVAKTVIGADAIKNKINIHQQSAKLIIVSKILYVLSMKVKTSFSNKATAHQ